MTARQLRPVSGGGPLPHGRLQRMRPAVQRCQIEGLLPLFRLQQELQSPLRVSRPN